MNRNSKYENRIVNFEVHSRASIPQGIMEHLWIKMRSFAHAGQQLETETTRDRSGPVFIDSHSDRFLKAMLSSNSKTTIIHQRLAMHLDLPALGLNAMLKPAIKKSTNHNFMLVFL